MKIQQILTKYWGYSVFRPLQEDIIQSVLAGNDTLALLPTGGGKSLCYQVPALAKEGLCIVVSPLIALMKDQVENLNKRNIKAIAIYSGMSRNEIDIAFDNAVYNKEIKLLYLSPERLGTDIFHAKLKHMKVNLLAVDEAHCISQWGYDFRPPYLKIADVREFLPGIPVIALTATATPEVVDDIQKQLLFSKKNLLQKSFERDNLSYFVKKEENKLQLLLKIVQKNKGSGIVYVRNRRKTNEIASFLNKNNCSSDFYHAGLDSRLRDEKQNSWKSGLKRVMVCTNAFGMGIDKPDVRFVVHLDLPESIEAYFQEAGRAGRDEKKAFAVMLYENADIQDAYKHFEFAYPPKETIKKIYNCLCNYFHLAAGSGADTTYPFIIGEFSEHYNLPVHTVFNSLKFLEKEGFIALSEAMHEPSKLHITANNTELYRFELENAKYVRLIKTILRMYSGLFNDYVKIDEDSIAQKSSTKTGQVIAMLDELEKMNVILYKPRSDKPEITFVCERLPDKNIQISDQNYKILKENALKRLEAVTDYLSGNTKCRSQFLLNYFGEKNNKRCGICDVCLKRNELGLTELEFDNIVNMIKPLLKDNGLTIDQIKTKLKSTQEDKLIAILRWLTDNDKISVDKEGIYKWY
ncbi:MAG: RecQ family ATP-dependent DNA helicase [Bacteroidales bacterium]|nr:RecQ family ATP-dependent DNA helicase [Bacteroidales bacterium]MDD4215568.1 RecQ family ATP-dependent DNA helicase [Bacteroidales bacterium]